MKQILPAFLWLLACTGAFYGCKKDLPKGMEPGYFKIYDDQNAGNSYRMLDMQETADGGTLILSELNHTRIHLTRVDKNGEYLTSAEITGGSKNPLPTLLHINDTYYVGCMDEVGLFTRFIKIDPGSCQPESVVEFPDLLYPLAFSVAEGSSVLLLTYDRYGYKSQLSKVSPDGQVLWTVEANVFQDTEALIVNQLNGTGKRYPFFTLGWNGKYIANCFNNYSFSFLVFNAGSNAPDAIYNGSNFSSGVSAMYVLPDGSTALSRFSFGRSYLIPAFVPASGAVDLTDNMGGILVEEAESDSEFEFGTVTIDGTPYFCYAHNTENGRVAVGFLSGGPLKAKKYFGSSHNTFKIGSFRATKDNGLLVAGSFWVAGAFPRPALFKLNEKELYEVMGLKYK